MEWTFSGFLFLSSNSLILFWVVYRFFLANLTFFKWQRIYLLLAVIGSLILPFFSLPTSWINSFYLESFVEQETMPAWLNILFTKENLSMGDIYANYSYSSTPMNTQIEEVK